MFPGNGAGITVESRLNGAVGAGEVAFSDGLIDLLQSAGEQLPDVCAS